MRISEKKEEGSERWRDDFLWDGEEAISPPKVDEKDGSGSELGSWAIASSCHLLVST